MNKINNPNFRRPLLALFVLILASACSGTAAQATPTKAPLTIRVGYTSSKGPTDIPSQMAQQRLSAQGYVFEPTFYSSGELVVAALSQGQADFGYGNPVSFLLAASKGTKSKWISTKVANTFLVAGVDSIKSCADLANQRLGINSTGALNTTLINKYIKETCPGTQPQMVVVSGSDNRAAALIAGQLDASLLELGDWEQLDAKAPGKFHIIFNFAQDLPDIVITGLFVSEDFAAKHPEAVKDYLRANLQVNRDIAQDHSLVIDEAAKELDMDASTLKPVMEDYFRVNAWDLNGGLTDELVKKNLEFLKTLDGFDQSLTPDQAADLSYLNAVLDEIGRK